MVEIGERLVAADIDGAEHHRTIAGGVEHVLVQPPLRLALRERRGDEELEFGAEQPDPVGAGQVERGDVVAQPGVDHQRHAVAVERHRRLGLERGEGGAALLAEQQLGLERFLDRRGRPHEQAFLADVEHQHVALGDQPLDVADAPEHRHPHRARDDRHVRGQRSFLEHHALQPSAIVFEQLGGAQVARDQDRIVPQAELRGGAELARDDPDQPVGEVLQVVHPIGEQRIADLAHPHPRALLDALDRRLGGEPRIDRLVDPTAPALVIGEHLVGLEHLVVLAALAELGLAGHPVDLLAHLVERGIDAVALGLGVLGDGMLDDDPRLVEHRLPRRHPLDQLEPREAYRRGRLRSRRAPARGVDQPGVGDQLGEHHRHRLQRLDLDGRDSGAARRAGPQAPPPARSRRMIGTPAKLWKRSSPVSGR